MANLLIAAGKALGLLGLGRSKLNELLSVGLVESRRIDQSRRRIVRAPSSGAIRGASRTRAFCTIQSRAGDGDLSLNTPCLRSGAMAASGASNLVGWIRTPWPT